MRVTTGQQFAVTTLAMLFISAGSASVQAAPVSSEAGKAEVAITSRAADITSMSGEPPAQVVSASAVPSSTVASPAATAEATPQPTAGPALLPLSPGPSDIFRAGGTCTTTWSPAFAWTNGQAPWANFTIDLMTGSNDNMTKLATVAASLDGTDYNKTKYEFQCPDAQPYSKIYFLQFSNPSGANATSWTTRFTLASPNGETTPAEHATQPTGEEIPWGQGKLISVGMSASTDGNAGSSAGQAAIKPMEGSRAAALVSGKSVSMQSSSATATAAVSVTGLGAAAVAACVAAWLL